MRKIRINCFVIAFMILIMSLSLDVMPVTASVVHVTASRDRRNSGTIKPGKTYKVKVTNCLAALTFTVPETGWYSFQVSELKEINVKKQKDESFGYFYLQNKNDVNEAKKDEYRYMYCREFKKVYDGKKRKLVKGKFYLSVGSDTYCKSVYNKYATTTTVKSPVSEGVIKLKKGKSYVFTSDLIGFMDFNDRTEEVKDGWTYKLKLKKIK